MYDDPSTRKYQPKSGQRIIGAGMHVTTLKVVGATSKTRMTLAIGYNTDDPYNPTENNGLEGFEASDFTVDCNMREHIGKGVLIGAVFAPGRRVKLRRIRAVDFGTEDWQSTGYECFVITSGGAHPHYAQPYDCVIEDCLIEKPYKNGQYVSTCLMQGGGEVAQVMAYHRGCVVRRNLINCEYQDNPVPISSITVSGATAKVTTKLSHGRGVNDWVVITGALENSVPSVHFNGSFKITEVPAPNQFKYEFFGTTPVEPTGDMWIGKTSSEVVRIKTASTDSDPYNPGVKGVTVIGTSSPWTIELTTIKPHLKIPGDNVAVKGVTDINQPPPGLVSLVNGLFQITDVLNPAKLRFVMTSTPGTPDAIQPSNARINSGYNGISADQGIGSVVEKNRVYNVGSGYYHDTYGSKDLIIRKNHFSSVRVGIYHNLFGVSGLPPTVPPAPPIPIPPNLEPDSLTPLQSPSKIALLQTKTAHGWSAGQGVVVTGATPSAYNGTFSILSVPEPKKFTYEMTSEQSSGASGTIYWGAFWQVDFQILNRNLIDLVLGLGPGDGSAGFPEAIILYGAGEERSPGRVFRVALVRNNIIRSLDNAMDPDLTAALHADSCASCIVEANIVNLSSTQPIGQSFSDSVKYFNNETPDGKLIQGRLYEPGTSRSFNELTLDAELALLLIT